MSYIDWVMKGVKVATCSCDYGCPCEFNAAPTRTPCEGLEAMAIEEGYFGDVRLDGLRFGATYRWPGPVHLGQGVVQGIVDEKANPAQREALIKILSGEEQEAHTAFNIYGSTIEEEKETLFMTIDMDWDFEARTGRVSMPGVAELAIEPIKNPVTGKPHHAMIRLHTGFEFRDAEIASGTASGTGEIKFDFAGRYAYLSRIHYTPYGLGD